MDGRCAADSAVVKVSRLERAWRRWRLRNVPPREAWVTLLDPDGNQIGPAHPVVLRCEPEGFTATTKPTWRMTDDVTVAAIAVTDADGKRTIKMLGAD